MTNFNIVKAKHLERPPGIMAKTRNLITDGPGLVSCPSFVVKWRHTEKRRTSAAPQEQALDYRDRKTENGHPRPRWPRVAKRVVYVRPQQLQ